MFSLTCKLSLTLAAAVALAILTASLPASSDERVANLGQDTRAAATCSALQGNRWREERP